MLLSGFSHIGKIPISVYRRKRPNSPLQGGSVAQKIRKGGEKIGIFSGIAKVAAVAVVGPAALPLLMAGNWNGIDGYNGGCDDE